eukprot:1074799-Prymnesium_polylepis.1
MPWAVRPQANAKRQRASPSRAHPCPESNSERCRAVGRAPPSQRQVPANEREPRPPAPREQRRAMPC